MGIRHLIRITVVIITFAIITILASCEDMVIVVCTDCYEDPPTETAIKVKVNDNFSSSSQITIDIYNGEFEDGILNSSFLLSSTSDTPFTLQVNKKYTFVATYSVNGKTYIAFDSITPSVKYSESDCETPCYMVYDDTADLYLRYIE